MADTRSETYEQYSTRDSARNFEQYILNFLRKNEHVKDEMDHLITESTSALLSSGHISRLLDQMTSVDTLSDEEFAKEYLHALQNNNFSEYTLQKTANIVHALLKPNGQLKDEVLQILADRTGQSFDDMKKLLYGNPIQPGRVDDVASKMVSGAVTAISSRFGDIVKEAKRSDAAPSAFKKLIPYEYLTTGLNGYEPVDESTVTFFTYSKNLSYNKFVEYTDHLTALQTLAKSLVDLRQEIMSTNDISDAMKKEANKVLTQHLTQVSKHYDQSKQSPFDIVERIRASLIQKLKKVTTAESIFSFNRGPESHEANQSKKALSEILGRFQDLPSKEEVILAGLRKRAELLESVAGRFAPDAQALIKTANDNLNNIAQLKDDPTAFEREVQNFLIYLNEKMLQVLPEKAIKQEYRHLDLSNHWNDFYQQVITATTREEMQRHLTDFKLNVDNWRGILTSSYFEHTKDNSKSSEEKSTEVTVGNQSEAIEDTPLRKMLLGFLSDENNTDTRSRLNSFFNGEGASHLGRIFNLLPDLGEAPEVFTQNYRTAIENNYFVPYTINKVADIVDLLLKPNGELREDVLKILAKQAGKDVEEARTFFYGKPPQPENIDKIAKQIICAVSTANSMVFASTPALVGEYSHLVSSPDKKTGKSTPNTLQYMDEHMTFESLMTQRFSKQDVDDYIKELKALLVQVDQSPVFDDKAKKAVTRNLMGAMHSIIDKQDNATYDILQQEKVKLIQSLQELMTPPKPVKREGRTSPPLIRHAEKVFGFLKSKPEPQAPVISTAIMQAELTTAINKIKGFPPSKEEIILKAFSAQVDLIMQIAEREQNKELISDANSLRAHLDKMRREVSDPEKFAMFSRVMIQVLMGYKPNGLELTLTGEKQKQGGVIDHLPSEFASALENMNKHLFSRLPKATEHERTNLLQQFNAEILAMQGKVNQVRVRSRS